MRLIAILLRFLSVFLYSDTQSSKNLKSGLIIFRWAFVFRYVGRKGPPWKQALRTFWWSAHRFRPRATRLVAWQDLDKCEVWALVWCGGPWQWLCTSIRVSHDVRSWIRSGPHSPLRRYGSRVLIWPFLCHAYLPLVRVLWSFSREPGRKESKWQHLNNSREGEEEWRVFGRWQWNSCTCEIRWLVESGWEYSRPSAHMGSNRSTYTWVILETVQDDKHIFSASQFS